MLCYKKWNDNLDNAGISICQSVIYYFSVLLVRVTLHVWAASLGGASRLFGHKLKKG